MLRKLKFKLRETLAYLLYGAAMCATLAAAPAEAQTYVRPSKGAAVVAFDTANPSATQLSAVYDMSAFVEAQFDAVLTYPNGSVTRTFNVSNFSRYIKIQAVYDNVPQTTSVTYNILGSDSPGGVFTLLNAPGASQIVMPQTGAGLAYTNAKLIVSPLPYSTIQYTRPSKGDTIVAINKVISTGPNGGIPNTPTIDMHGFSALSVGVDFDNTGCRYGLNLVIYGGDTQDQGQMRLLVTANSLRSVSADVAYAVNVPTSYIFVGGNIFDLGSGNDCTVAVRLTPLPYTISDTSYGKTATSSQTRNLDAVGTFTQISTYDYYSTLRIQNVGAGAVSCGVGSSAATQTIELVPATSPGDGGVLTLSNYSGSWYCRSISGVATTLRIFAY